MGLPLTSREQAGRLLYANVLTYTSLTGVASARPAAAVRGRTYFATDTDVLSIDDGANWHDISGGVTPPTAARIERFDPVWPNTQWFDPEEGEYGEDPLKTIELWSDEGGGRQWYEVATDSLAAQSVVFNFRWKLPTTWTAWNVSSAFVVYIQTTDTTGDSYLDLQVYQGTSLKCTKSSQKSATWLAVTFTASDLEAGWAAGDVLTLTATFVAKGVKVARAAEIEIGYTA